MNHRHTPRTRPHASPVSYPTPSTPATTPESEALV
jgi:hypothetical protein